MTVATLLLLWRLVRLPHVSTEEAARFLDRHYRLEERIASAWYCRQQERQERFPALFSEAAHVLRQLSGDPYHLPLPATARTHFYWPAILLCLATVLYCLSEALFHAPKPLIFAIPDDVAATLQQGAAALARAQQKETAARLQQLAGQPFSPAEMRRHLLELHTSLSRKIFQLEQQKPAHVVHSSVASTQPPADGVDSDPWPALAALDAQQLQRLQDRLAALAQEGDSRWTPLVQSTQEGKKEELAKLLRELASIHSHQIANLRHAQSIIAGLLQRLGGQLPLQTPEGTSASLALSAFPGNGTDIGVLPSKQWSHEKTASETSIFATFAEEARRSYWKKGWWPTSYQRVVEKYFAGE
jgi:hypothetical protein